MRRTSKFVLFIVAGFILANLVLFSLFGVKGIFGEIAFDNRKACKSVMVAQHNQSSLEEEIDPSNTCYEDGNPVLDSLPENPDTVLTKTETGFRVDSTGEFINITEIEN